MDVLTLTDYETRGTPDWWLMRLGLRLDARLPKLAEWRRWYTGEHPLPEGPRKATDAFREFQKSGRTNFTSAVVNSSTARMRVIGIEDATGRPDAEAWGWWQRNRLSSRQSQVYRTASMLSEAYVMVGAHPADATRPLITVEHPREVIVEHDPATRERAAGLKAWYDDALGRGRANLFLAPNIIVRYQTDERPAGRLPWNAEAWEPIEEPRTHGLASVPVVPFQCRPDLGEPPEPEFSGVIDIQTRINFGVFNRMVAERYSAFRQKNVTGHKFKRFTDPITGLEVVEQPFVPDPGGVWASEGKDTKFGEFSQTQLDGYLRAHEMDIRDLLVISRTPAYYYAGDLINIGSETLQALDLLHVAKVEEMTAEYAESWEDVYGLSSQVAGVERDYTMSEVRWQDPRQFNPSVVADMATKYHSIGYPLAIVAEKSGESPQRVQRIVSEAAAAQLSGAQALEMAAQARVEAQAPIPAVVDGGA